MEQESGYIQSIATVEDMQAVARDIVRQYCEENEINEKDIYPSIWDDIIDELYIKLFKPCNRLLKTDNNRYNEYDRDKVLYVYNIYKRLCNSHCQEVHQKGFCDMTGINKQTLYNWSEDKLSSVSFDLQQKIMEDNENSLFSLMKDRRMNPMKLLPKLNKVHGWSMPGVSQNSGGKREMGLADIRQQLKELSENGAQLAITDGESP